MMASAISLPPTAGGHAGRLSEAAQRAPASRVTAAQHAEPQPVHAPRTAARKVEGEALKGLVAADQVQVHAVDGQAKELVVLQQAGRCGVIEEDRRACKHEPCGGGRQA